MSRRPGRAVAVAATVVCSVAATGLSPSTAAAASAVASCKPTPTKAAKRLEVRAARHVRRGRAARRAARMLRRNNHPLRARRALHRARRHRAAVRRLRSRARTCTHSARHRTGSRLVRFRRPLGGARLRGLVNGSSCHAVTREGRAIDRVVFKVDGRTLNTERVAPYTCGFDTTRVPNGWHWLEARAFDATGRSSATRLRVRVANAPPRRRTGTAVGVEGTIRWRAGEDLVDTVGQLRAAGATHTRESIAWYRVEPARGQWTFDAIDPWVGEAARQGLRIVALLDGPPAWATGTTDRQVAPVEGRALADYANYARRLVARYGTSGSFWSENPDIPKLPIVQWNVWNEPYMPTFWHNGGEHAFPDPGGYARMFKRVASEASKADPNAEFMAEVEISSVEPANQPFLARMFRAVPDLGDHMDIAGNHPYVSLDGRSPERCELETTDMANRYNFCRVKTIRHMLDRYGARDAELWLTEFGYSTCPSCSRWDVSEEAQAQYVRDAFRLVRRWGVVDGFIWWVYKTPEKDPNHAEDWMGLVRADDSPKPAWLAFADEARRGL
jgi:polysaccharide biosynthesis protein PslG